MVAGRLAQPLAASLLVFGAGLQAETHVLAMLEVRPSITSVVIVNRTLPAASGLQAKLLSRFGTSRAVTSHRSLTVTCALFLKSLHPIQLIS